MKVMLAEITNGMKMEDLFPAQNTNGIFGIFCSTVMGGKKFWTYEELEKLFVHKIKNGKNVDYRYKTISA